VLVTILTVLEVLYVVALATWILFEKRSPVATLAWILSLIALPYVGFFIFFLLGPRRLFRKRLKHRRARGKVRAAVAKEMKDPNAIPPDPRIAQIDRLAVRAGEAPADRCEEVEIFHDAASTYDAIEKAIREAKHHVHVAYYIFDSGEAGTRIGRALAAKAKEGVEVRLLLDDVGSSAMKRSFRKELRAAGVRFALFNRVTFSRIRSRFDFRNHRKIVVVDGAIGFTGGINITDDYVGTPPWRDTHVRIAGDAVRWLQLTFLDDWHYATGYVPREAAYFPPPTEKGEHRVQIVGSGPDRDLEPIQKTYFAAMGLAGRQVEGHRQPLPVAALRAEWPRRLPACRPPGLPGGHERLRPQRLGQHLPRCLR
jgi:cardiolipin synthase